MRRALIIALIILLVVPPVAGIIAIYPGFVHTAQAVMEPYETDFCGGGTIYFADDSPPPGMMRVHFQHGPLLAPVTIARVNFAIYWQSWTPDNFTFGSIVESDVPGANGRVSKLWEVPTGPGLVTGYVIGTVVTTTGMACLIPFTSTWAEIAGSSGGVTYNADLPVPQTADLNNDNQADDTHCGNACNKAQDQATETEQNALRVKICYQLDRDKDHNAFKACKKSGNLAISAREGHGWPCWYEINRDQWLGPTAPENAPTNPNGSAYSGEYFGDCGFQVPPRPTVNPNPRPTPHLVGCVIVTPVPTGSGLIQCYDDAIHAIANQPYAATTATPRPTPTMPTYVTELYVIPDEATQGDAVTVEWSNVPNPTSVDMLVLYDAVSGVEPDTNHGQTRRWTDNCVKPNGGNHGSTAAGSGSCAVAVDSHLAQGTYEFRIYRNGVLATVSNSWLRTPSECEINPGSCSE